MPETIPSASIPMILVSLALLLTIIGSWIGMVLRIAFGLRVLPTWTPRRVPWGGGVAFMGILIWLAVQVLVPEIYRAVVYPTPAGAPAHELSPGEHMALSALSNAFLLAIIPLTLRATSGARLRDFGLATDRFIGEFSRGVIAYPLIAPVVIAVMLCAGLIWKKTSHPLENALRSDHDPVALVILVLAGVVFAPLSEELAFRGVFLGWLTKVVLGPARPKSSDFGLDEPGISTLDETPESASDPIVDLARDPENPYAAPRANIAPAETVETEGSTPTSNRRAMLLLANVLVSVIFAGLHASVWPTPIPIFFLSLGLGMLYQRTGSLIAPMALHMTFNGVSTLLMILSLGMQPPKAKEEVKPEPPPKVEVKAAFEAGPNRPAPAFPANLV